MKQRTEQWYMDRAGVITASRFGDVQSYDPQCWAVVDHNGRTVKKLPNEADALRFKAEKQSKAKTATFEVVHVPLVSKQARETYMSELVVERLSGAPVMIPENYALQWGKDNEPLALAAYEAKTTQMVREVEFIKSDVLHCGASPDGLINDDGGIEIKCPVNAIKHIHTLRKNEMPDEHIPQVQGQMAVADLQWVDFVSFDPRLPEHLQLFIKRIERDQVYIDTLLNDISVFESELSQTTASLQKMEIAA